MCKSPTAALQVEWVWGRVPGRSVQLFLLHSQPQLECDIQSTSCTAMQLPGCWQDPHWSCWHAACGFWLCASQGFSSMPSSTVCHAQRRDLAGSTCALRLCHQLLFQMEVSWIMELTQASELEGGKDLVVTPGPGSTSPSFSCEIVASIRVCWSVFMFAALQLHLDLKGICSLSN